MAYANTYITNSTYVTLNDYMANKPYIDLNKGARYRITRVDSSITSTFESRYLIQRY